MLSFLFLITCFVSSMSQFPYCNYSSSCQNQNIVSNTDFLVCTGYKACENVDFTFTEYAYITCTGSRICGYGATFRCMKGCHISCNGNAACGWGAKFLTYADSYINCYTSPTASTAHVCRQDEFYVYNGTLNLTVTGKNGARYSVSQVSSGAKLHVTNGYDNTFEYSTFNLERDSELKMDCTTGTCENMEIINYGGNLELTAGTDANTFGNLQSNNSNNSQISVYGCDYSLNICENMLFRLYDTSSMNFINNYLLEPIYLYDNAVCQNCRGGYYFGGVLYTSEPTQTPTLTTGSPTQVPTRMSFSPTKRPTKEPTDMTNEPTQYPTAFTSSPTIYWDTSEVTNFFILGTFITVRDDVSTLKEDIETTFISLFEEYSERYEAPTQFRLDVISINNLGMTIQIKSPGDIVKEQLFDIASSDDFITDIQNNLEIVFNDNTFIFDNILVDNNNA